MGELQGRRDELEMNIREALGLFFDVKADRLQSQRRAAPSHAISRGWEETILAYIHVKAKDASVDKIPRIQMSLEFLDLTGPVQDHDRIRRDHDQSDGPADSAAALRPRGADPDPRSAQLDTTEEILLDVKATACGLVPELEALLDLDALRQQLPVARIDPHEGTVLRQVNSWGDTVHAVSERHWTWSSMPRKSSTRRGESSCGFPNRRSRRRSPTKPTWRWIWSIWPSRWRRSARARR